MRQRIAEGQLAFAFVEVTPPRARAPKGKAKPPRDARLPPVNREEIPAESDLCWYLWTAPLLEFLHRGAQEWVVLYAWAEARRVSQMLLRNMVAWLETKKKLRFEGALLHATGSLLSVPRNKA